MRKIAILIMLILFTISCDNNDNIVTGNSDVENTSWVFIANEGNFGSSNGSISMIDDFGNVYETEPIGDVVQSLEVYEDKLIVLVNNSHKIKIYNITSDGLDMPGIEVSTNGSSPREMVVVDGMVYFTNWNTYDVKVFNLHTYNIDTSIPVGYLPEGIITDGTTLWVAISGGGEVYEIDIESRNITNIHDVGEGPQNLTINNGEVFVSRTYYSGDWTETYHGSSKIGSEIIINNYGLGTACGGSVLSHQNNVYRSFNGGLSKVDSNLDLEEVSIGNFNQNQVYHVERINDNFWFALTDYQDMNEVHVLDSNGNPIAVYNVGKNPGDFTFWNKYE